VDSSRTGAEEDKMGQRLLAVDSPDEPTEIVVHVNMLKEGWDVTNLYTIVPLRAANARILDTHRTPNRGGAWWTGQNLLCRATNHPHGRVE
jgi:hypothetical protein